MILKEIKLVKSEPMFCIESGAATFAVLKNRNYEMMFSGMWGFKLLPDDPKYRGIFGERVSADFKVDDQINLMAHYHGIRIFAHQEENPEVFIKNAIKELNKGKPVALHIDESCLPWVGKKGEGFILLIGHQNNKSFFCFDTHNDYKYNSYETRAFPVDKIYNQSGNSSKAIRYYTFAERGKEQKAISYQDLKLNIEKSSSLGGTPFQDMRDAAEYIDKKLDHTVEKCLVKEIGNAPLLSGVMHISRARKLLASSADYIWRITGDQLLYNISSDFMELGYEWHQVWHMLFRFFYFPETNNELKQNIAKRIMVIAEQEESLINAIIHKEYKSAPVFIREEEITGQEPDEPVMFLDIKNYMNNKGFAGDESNAEGANLTGRGDFYISAGLPNDGLIHCLGMKFTIHYRSVRFDNISCSHQIISIPKGCYQRLMFLGCSDWGDGIGSLKVMYDSGRNEKTLLNISGWDNMNSKNAKNAVIAWKGKGGYIKQITARYLFAVSFLLPKEEAIKEIQLPDIPTMHIFGISLGVSAPNK